ncbi:MAG: leucine-rich repeat protein [Muricoprocola sp.]
MKQISTLLLAASMSLSMVMGNTMAMEEVTEEVAYEEISEEYVEEMEAGEKSPEEEATIIVDDFVYEVEGLEEEAGDAEEVILEEEVDETEEMTDAAALEEEEPQMSGKCGDNVTYELKENDDSFKYYNDETGKMETSTDAYTLVISGSGAMWDFHRDFDEGRDEWLDGPEPGWSFIRGDITRIVVESGVSRIGEFSFAWMNHVKEVTLPSTLTSVGGFAFHNLVNYTYDGKDWNLESGLEQITIPASVTSIERGAFSDCEKLSKVNYSGEIANVCPNGTYDDGSAWSNRNRVVEAFWNTPFGENYGLSGKCGDNVTYQLTRNSDSFKFYNDEEQRYDTCTDCYTLTISGSGAMWDYAYDWDEDGNEIREKATPWDDFRWNITRIVVNPGVTEIGDWAFIFSHHVNSVSLPNGLKKIGFRAFYCSQDGEGEDENWHATSGLKEITIPSTVTSIDFGAFADCGMLTKVNYAGEIADICPSGEEDGVPWTNKIRVMTVFWGSPFAENYLPWNAITVNKDTVSLKANATKAQSFTLGAANTAKLPMKYTSSSSSVKVDASGKVTVSKNFAGTAKINITTAATEEYQAGTKVVTVKVAKLAQPMKVSASTTSVKLSAVKKKAQKVTLKVTKAQGKVTYTSSSKKYVTVSAKGTVTLKKGTPKGTYKITVKAAGKGIYAAGSKVISIKVK